MRDAMRRRGGFTLVESMVALLIASMVILAVFSVALTTRRNFARVDRKFRMAAAAKSAIDEFKDFVAHNGGKHPLDLCASPCTPSGQGNCRVFVAAPCVHDLTLLLPADLRASPFNATLTYTASGYALSGNTLSQVTFDFNWTE